MHTRIGESSLWNLMDYGARPDTQPWIEAAATDVNVTSYSILFNQGSAQVLNQGSTQVLKRGSPKMLKQGSPKMLK